MVCKRAPEDDGREQERHVTATWAPTSASGAARDVSCPMNHPRVATR